jgi:hypothetical protein
VTVFGIKNIVSGVPAEIEKGFTQAGFWTGNPIDLPGFDLMAWDDTVWSADDDRLPVLKGFGNPAGPGSPYVPDAAGIGAQRGDAGLYNSGQDITYADLIETTTGAIVFTYDGKTKTIGSLFDVHFKDNVANPTLATLLEENTDYYWTHSNNAKAGTATATLNGTGNYKGTQEYNFTINKKTL